METRYLVFFGSADQVVEHWSYLNQTISFMFTELDFRPGESQMEEKEQTDQQGIKSKI